MTSSFQVAASMQAVLTQQNYLESRIGLPGPLTVLSPSEPGQHALRKKINLLTLTPLEVRGKGQMLVRTEVEEGMGLGDIHFK